MFAHQLFLSGLLVKSHCLTVSDGNKIGWEQDWLGGRARWGRRFQTKGQGPCDLSIGPQRLPLPSFLVGFRLLCFSSFTVASTLLFFPLNIVLDCGNLDYFCPLENLLSATGRNFPSPQRQFSRPNTRNTAITLLKWNCEICKAGGVLGGNAQGGAVAEREENRSPVPRPALHPAHCISELYLVETMIMKEF